MKQPKRSLILEETWNTEKRIEEEAVARWSNYQSCEQTILKHRGGVVDNHIQEVTDGISVDQRRTVCTLQTQVHR